MKENRQGIMLVVIAMTVFTLQDVLIKLLSNDVSLFQILFFRSTIGIVLIISYLKLTRQSVKWGTAYPVLSVCRGLLFFSGYSLFYFAQSKVPIANATVLFLVSPFFITIMCTVCQEVAGTKKEKPHAVCRMKDRPFGICFQEWVSNRP